MNGNLIFLKDSDLDKPIYRIFSFSRLEEIFQERKLTLVKPRLWDDPFENFILNATGRLNDGREFDFGFRDSFYGQCWSLSKESDAMWRIYSPNKDGVKVKTTIRKLFEPLFLVGGEFTNPLTGNEYNLRSFVGKVRYESTKKLTNMLKDEERMGGKVYDHTGWGQASSFFFKRWAFKHEREVRLVYNAQNDNLFDFFKFNINPLTAFDEIVFDPRMNVEMYHLNRSQILNWGYDKPIKQSALYKIQSFTINLPMPI